MMGCTVLLYHRVHPRFGVHPRLFEEHLKVVTKVFRPLSFDEFLSGRWPFPSLLMTFDDGFYDFYRYAFPLLKRYGVPSVLFVPPGRVYGSDEVRDRSSDSEVSTVEAYRRSFKEGDNSAFLSWGELRRLTASGLVSVQSHGYSHRAAVGSGKPFKPPGDWRAFSLGREVSPGTPLTSLLVEDLEEARRELKLSRELLESKLGTKVEAVAWPWGIYSEQLVELARTLGYRACFTTERGWNRPGNLCRVKRLAVGDTKGPVWLLSRSLLYAL